MSVEELLRQRLPAPVFSAMRWIYNRRPSVVRARRQYAEDIAAGRAVAEAHRWIVQAGPFAGLRYVDAYGDLGAKIIGSYELELHDTVERLVGRGYETVVNVGAAEGYYAAGFARRLPEARVIAYEVSQAGRVLCAELAAKNDLVVDVRGEFTDAELQQLPPGRVLLLMDIEGGELPLLDPARAPGLRTVDMLVELHDFIDPTIKPTILRRFADTHDAELIRTTDRDPRSFPALPPGTERVLDEHRPTRMEWVLLTSRAGGHTLV